MDLRKLIITALCLAVSSGVCWQTWRKLRGSGPSVEMFEPEDDEFRELIEAAGETLQKIENFPDSPLIRYALPEELAPKFFPLHHPWNEYDPFAYYVHTPNLDAWRAFPEHPEGGFRMRTNSLGLRCDYEPAVEKPHLRVLIAGDSHIDGICNNSEAFAAVAEAELERRFPGRTIEILNAARGGYSFYNYLGTYEKYAPGLEPDALIVFVAGSNDFAGVLRLGHLFNRTLAKGRNAIIGKRRVRANAAAPGVLGTGPGMLYHFKHLPGEVEVAFRITRQICEEIRRLCERDGVRLIFAFHPSSNAIGWEDPPEGLPLVLEMLELTTHDEGLHDILAEQFIALMHDLDIESIDLTQAFTGTADEYFWRSDLHMNITGQARMAEALLPWLEALPELR